MRIVASTHFSYGIISAVRKTETKPEFRDRFVPMIRAFVIFAAIAASCIPASAETYAVVNGIEIGDVEAAVFAMPPEVIEVLRNTAPNIPPEALTARLHSQAVIEAVTLVALGEAGRNAGVFADEDDVLQFSIHRLPFRFAEDLAIARKWNAALANDIDAEDKFVAGLNGVTIEWRLRPDIGPIGVEPQ